MCKSLSSARNLSKLKGILTAYWRVFCHFEAIFSNFLYYFLSVRFEKENREDFNSVEDKNLEFGTRCKIFPNVLIMFRRFLELVASTELLRPNF